MKNEFLILLTSILLISFVVSCKIAPSPVSNQASSSAMDIESSQENSAFSELILSSSILNSVDTSQDDNDSVTDNKSTIASSWINSNVTDGPEKYDYRNINYYPVEDSTTIFNNPDMGWMIYENYCVSRNESTITNSAGEMKDYLFPGVDNVAIMFTWADIEKSEGVYDWMDVERAYDYWQSKGKKIMLRMSTESLLWYGAKAKGIPDYLYNRIPDNQKQTLTTMQGNPATSWTYRGVDFRNEDYQNRLIAYLKAVNTHFGESRPIEYVDLAGYGLWGEWHCGYIYPGEIKGYSGPGDLTAKREGLEAVIDIWSAAFPTRWLSLSYSYDPDSPSRFYADSNYLSDFEQWSSFDYALTKTNIAWRRNGAGGAVQVTDRVFGEKAFKISKGPFAVEAAQGYVSSTVGSLIDEELQLHPNYMNIPGWGYTNARKFIEEQPDLMKKGLLNMGYRLVPEKITVPDTISRGQNMRVSVSFTNKGVGKVTKDYNLRVIITDTLGKIISEFDLSSIPTSGYIKDVINPAASAEGVVPSTLKPGVYKISLALYDTQRKIYISLAADGNGAPVKTGGFCIGSIKIL